MHSIRCCWALGTLFALGCAGDAEVSTATKSKPATKTKSASPGPAVTLAPRDGFPKDVPLPEGFDVKKKTGDDKNFAVEMELPGRTAKAVFSGIAKYHLPPKSRWGQKQVSTTRDGFTTAQYVKREPPLDRMEFKIYDKDGTAFLSISVERAEK